jgi:hypothetical protein
LFFRSCLVSDSIESNIRNINQISVLSLKIFTTKQ